MKLYSQQNWQKSSASDDNAVILDVRTPEEYNEAHIPGAQLMNVQDPQSFMKSLEKLDKSKNFYVYCRSGKRSNKACLVLDHNGFENVYDLEGGIEAWTGKTE